jgi:hypothetical protein
MRRLAFSATTVLIALACGTVQASEWVSIGKSNDGTQEVFVDVSSIRITGGIRRAWTKTVYAPRTTRSKSGEYANKWWSSDLSREAYNCLQETHSREALNVYFIDGDVAISPPETLPTPWQPVPPDTATYAEMQFICAWKAK